jgi:hypothetical protein
MKRGRPPIGDKPMTSAERQRRYLDRIRGTAAVPPPTLPKASGAAPWEAELTKLKSECAKLRSENAMLKRLLERARLGRPHP